MFKKRRTTKLRRGFFEKNKELIAIFTLVGTIVGAGMLGIPYAVAKVGFLLGFLLVVGIGIAFIFMNLFVGEVVLRTKEQHQLTGYAHKYLGINGKRLMALSMFISIYGALSAYLIGEGATLYSMFKVGSPLLFSLVFFLIVFLITYRGLKATGKAELITVSLLIITIFAVGAATIPSFSFSNLSGFNPEFLILPFGVVLFSLLGSPAIPEMQIELVNQKHKLKRAIIIGSIIPIVLYLFFTFFLVGSIGLENFELLAPNERIATIALSIYSSPMLGFAANLVAIFAMFTSFLTLAIALIQVFEFDYHFPKEIATILTFSIPLLITIFDLSTFITILGVTGIFAGGLEGILIILMFWKAKGMGDRKPEYKLEKNYIIGTILIAMFGLGIGYQLVSMFL